MSDGKLRSDLPLLERKPQFTKGEQDKFNLITCQDGGEELQN